MMSNETLPMTVEDPQQESKQATQLPRAPEPSELLAAIIESAEDAIVSKTLEGTITSWNKGAEKLFGYTAAEAIGKSVTMLIPSGHPDEEPGILARIKSGEGVEHYETVRVRKDGTLINVSLTVSPVKAAGGKIIGASKIARDITKLKQAEISLRESESRFSKAFNASPLALTISSLKDGRLVEVNQSFVDITGFSREESVGQTTLELGLWDKSSDRQKELKAVREQGQVRSVEYVFRTKDGSEIIGLLSAEQIEIGGESFALTVIQDITARKRAEKEREELLRFEQLARKQAEEANRLKDEFLATVSHELRTPLTAILGWAHMLRTNRLDKTEVGKALDTIERNARTQAQLVDDLLDVSRAITGKLRLDIKPVEPTSFVDAAIETAQPAAQAKNVLIQRIVEPGILSIAGDTVRLQQVVWNLISNAIKFTGHDGRVQVRLRRVNNHLEISVSDTGVGIAPEFLPFVFDRFSQADQRSTRRHGGLGLGLAIVRHLVELHGGTVHAESPGVGEGSIFTVQLPMSPIYLTESSGAGIQTAAQEYLESYKFTDRLDGLKVLVVDDEEDTREVLSAGLRQCGAEVTVAGSVSEALESMKVVLPDLIVSDIAMPGEDGYDLIRYVRALPADRGGRVPAVALTAYARADDRMRALREGYQMHVPKPVELAELAAVAASIARRV